MVVFIWLSYPEGMASQKITVKVKGKLNARLGAVGRLPTAPPVRIHDAHKATTRYRRRQDSSQLRGAIRRGDHEID